MVELNHGEKSKNRISLGSLSYNNKDISAISKGITKVEKEIISDIDLQKAMYRIEVAVRKASKKKYANS